MTSSRATRSRAHYLPEMIPADDNDLDHRIVCPISGGIYLIVGESAPAAGSSPSMSRTCTRYRPPTEPTTESIN